MVAYTDTINGFGLLVAGLMVPILALISIGEGNVLAGLSEVLIIAPINLILLAMNLGLGQMPDQLSCPSRFYLLG